MCIRDRLKTEYFRKYLQAEITRRYPEFTCEKVDGSWSRIVFSCVRSSTCEKSYFEIYDILVKTNCVLLLQLENNVSEQDIPKQPNVLCKMLQENQKLALVGPFDQVAKVMESLDTVRNLKYNCSVEMIPFIESEAAAKFVQDKILNKTQGFVTFDMLVEGYKITVSPQLRHKFCRFMSNLLVTYQKNYGQHERRDRSPSPNRFGSEVRRTEERQRSESPSFGEGNQQILREERKEEDSDFKRTAPAPPLALASNVSITSNLNDQENELSNELEMTLRCDFQR
eukprot:TRINITY_DN4230_c0_g3_i3.p1 TRINITY_DN4230_c0_g3~~TRINITY_DN4230_c0_g3_i3.p1  ORF type:complete len:305 (+),score=36.71 TRINITY_DN4230_c0_g3_i3:69-917(+)